MRYNDIQRVSKHYYGRIVVNISKALFTIDNGDKVGDKSRNSRRKMVNKLRDRYFTFVM